MPAKSAGSPQRLAGVRAIYQAEGFRLKSSKKHRSFGKRLTAEIWEMQL